MDRSGEGRRGALSFNKRDLRVVYLQALSMNLDKDSSWQQAASEQRRAVCTQKLCNCNTHKRLPNLSALARTTPEN